MEILLQVREDFPEEIGDIIVARPDGHPWGAAECLGTFLVVRVPDGPELLGILESKEDGLGWYVDISQIPAAEIEAARSTDWHVIDIGLEAIEAR